VTPLSKLNVFMSFTELIMLEGAVLLTSDQSHVFYLPRFFLCSESRSGQQCLYDTEARTVQLAA